MTNPRTIPLDRARENVRLARATWGICSRRTLDQLRKLTQQYALSVAMGDLQVLDGRWYVTHAGLLGIANRARCSGIRTALQRRLSEPASNRWVFKATVYPSARSRGFVGYGDADESNVSLLVRGAEMRIAETRAVNRALRKAYGIGLCSVEELGWEPRTSPTPGRTKASPALNGNGHRNAAVSLRDRLCVLIRQHQLDANLVKAYAADFCGAPNLREASREQVESFIANLSEWAMKDRYALICKLNSYSHRPEVAS